VLKDISQNIEITSKTIGEKTGKSMILRSQVLKESDTFQVEADGDKTCNKDLVGFVTKNDYSRGLVFFVHSSGIIRQWYPIYGSEGSSQVAVQAIDFCSKLARTDGVEVVQNQWLFYDNMCNLSRLKLWEKEVTPENSTSDTRLGMKVFNMAEKGVDALHIRNHVRKDCVNTYPKVINRLRETFENPNTQFADFQLVGKV